MTALHIGQLVELDLFGLNLPGARSLANADVGVIVALDAGAITVRLGAGARAPEVTVSQHRLVVGHA